VKTLLYGVTSDVNRHGALIARSEPGNQVLKRFRQKKPPQHPHRLQSKPDCRWRRCRVLCTTTILPGSLELEVCNDHFLGATRRRIRYLSCWVIAGSARAVASRGSGEPRL